jgi:hypothetical protein
MFGKMFDNIVDSVTQPFEDAYDIVDGLTEGELREEAAARLGSQVVMTMTTAELVEWYNSEE